MKKLILSLILLSSLQGFSQSSTTTKEKNTDAINSYNQLADELNGAYQIQIINSRKQAIITFEMLQEIKNQMKDNKDVIIDFSPNLRVKALAKNTLSTNKYTEKEQVIYIEE